jgi:hypothetical protein
MTKDEAAGMTGVAEDNLFSKYLLTSDRGRRQAELDQCQPVVACVHVGGGGGCIKRS